MGINYDTYDGTCDVCGKRIKFPNADASKYSTANRIYCSAACREKGLIQENNERLENEEREQLAKEFESDQKFMKFKPPLVSTGDWLKMKSSFDKSINKQKHVMKKQVSGMASFYKKSTKVFLIIMVICSVGFIIYSMF